MTRRWLAYVTGLSLVAASVACEHPDGSDGDDESPSTASSRSPDEATDDDSKDDPSSSEETSESRQAAASEGDTACSPPESPGLTAVDVVEDHSFRNPVHLTQAPGDRSTLYIVERAGRILMVRDGELLETPFLDIRDRVDDSFTERGLLGLAFHPEYEDNGRFFIYYTPKDGHRNVVAEYRRQSAEPPRASTEEVARLLEPRDPEDNHNGGMITFGPDGYLYVGMGDGGGAGDRHGSIGNGQNISTPFGAMHRLDVDAADRGYAAEGNPFVDREGLDTIWAYGLRNPWRYSFDTETGDLYIADVGQNKFSEINVLPADASGGANFGWRAYEGTSVYDEELVDRVDDHVEPIHDWPLRSDETTLRGACSVTGGYVYRGEALEALEGAYIFGDYCSSDVAALRYCDGEVAGPVRLPGLEGQGQGLSSFGRNHEGELYLLYHDGGDVQKIVSD